MQYSSTWMGSALELVLLRHGESEGNRDRRFGGHGPARLTERGQRQADAAARAIWSTWPPGVIYSSDLPRALETAAPLATLSGLTLHSSPALRERSVGELTGRSFEEVQAERPEVWEALLKRDPDWCPPGGESHRMCTERIERFLSELFVHQPTGRVVLVSHGVAIDLMLRYFLGVSASSLERFLFHVDNASISRVVRHPGGLHRIVVINDTAHLAVSA